MPWIDVHYSRKLSQDETRTLKSEFASILKSVFDKNEGGLNVTFSDVYAFYRGGEPTDAAIVLDVRYIGHFTLEQKREVTKRMAETASRLLHVDPQKAVVLFSEIESENWGRGAGDFS